MNIEDLIHGESKNIEYKEMLPSNSDKYTKTVVAFANTQGGKIVFGIENLPPGKFGGPFITDLFLGKLDPSVDPYFEQIYQLEVSSHCLIRRTGEIIQYVSFYDRAWHAGKSTYEGRDRCNDFSIGIELEGTDTQPYTQQQYASLILATESIKQRFTGITNRRITGHCNIAPDRKTDPGKSFDWNFYLKGLSNCVEQ